ncbi:MAG: tRNA (guanosine(18)-2'-O)-methyltransferase TrmH [Deinococcota bacterium]|nr:tRNA (guanosine(18)-2'-O)-methyltransferase TrmH [Deinococcota bacterium]
MTLERYLKIMRVLRRRQPDLSVLVENVHKPHNLSAIIRSCDAVGSGVVHAVNPTGGVPTYSETSASADKWVELVVHPSLDVAWDLVRAQGMQLLAAHFCEDAIDYRDADYTRPTCVLVGNEKFGVSPRAASVADKHIVIPMLGMVQSLNVSVATAVILFEAQRQRREAGLYDAPRLSDEAMSRQAFLWLYPRQAERLLERDLPLPELDDRGDIVGSTKFLRSRRGS